MLYFYSQIGINLKFVTSNNPLSVIFISGITGNDKNDNIKKGLKSILDEIAFSEECKLFKSEITSFDEREVIIPPISREIEAKVLPRNGPAAFSHPSRSNSGSMPSPSRGSLEIGRAHV